MVEGNTMIYADFIIKLCDLADVSMNKFRQGYKDKEGIEKLQTYMDIIQSQATIIKEQQDTIAEMSKNTGDRRSA